MSDLGAAARPIAASRPNGEQARQTPAALASNVMDAWISEFKAAAEGRDGRAVAALFVPDGYWKDILSFTWSFRTFQGRDNIETRWQETQDDVAPRNIRLSPDRSAPKLTRRGARDVIEGFFDFDTKVGRGTAFVRLVPTDGRWSDPRAWIMLTTLQELNGAEECAGRRRPTHAAPRDDSERLPNDPQVLIIGGGQAGLTLAARLGQMGVDYLILEKNTRIGDNWRKRYDALTLHNDLRANHLPYLPFPETWPTFLPKDRLADWLETYANLLDLSVLTNAEVTAGRFDPSRGRWLIDVTCGNEKRQFDVPHIVIAVGSVSGVPNVPHLPGIENFAGEVIHSSEYSTGGAYRGKRALVFGTGNSAHDIAQDLYVSGAESVTMVQRGPTAVVSVEPSAALVYALYTEEIRSVEDIDLIMASVPYPILVESMQWLTRKTCKLDEDLLSRLKAAGFETEFEHDFTGFYMKYLRRGGGYYIDVGCAELIADRKIGLVQTTDIVGFTADGALSKEGDVLGTDLIVLATGYENEQSAIRRLLGDEVAERLGAVWGFDENYAMRNMWQRTAQQGLWLMGGALNDCRPYSRYLALQIVAELRNVPRPQA